MVRKPMHTLEGFEETTCTICRTSKAKTFLSGDYHLNLVSPIHVSQCQTCHLYFLSPRPDEKARMQLMQGAIPQQLRAYDTKIANYAKVTQNRVEKFEARLATIRQLVTNQKENISFLDVGASAGTLVQTANQSGFRAWGIEPSIGGTKAAYNEGVVLPQAKAEALPFKSEVFDIVHSHHVFEHLEDPLTAAKEIWRVLKPGGLIFLEVPNQFENVMFKRDLLFHRVPQRRRNIRSIHHLWFFSLPTIGKLLQEAGFQKINTQTLYSWHARGWRKPFSWLTRFVGNWAGGGDLLQAYARKSP